ncbi:maleylpyruvate isomerase family mycothiol-dependent enzyme [Thermostaphylospora chromogena]|jgi:uncharacterized protein (TIGR03083 family)|uniref:TIGR03083 family protein n=1 Tax=Thermostaphylospora chromogena TaxID=35622 RepID=A0A1H0ZWI0_9ACTN|nr:maleylpyruvate isomerase family mycothiol-dependent enzyme [Thermostaphylospora chromogena]SDQ31824.1 TIGR03083 family protein [Thermostaphylospora chromogena]
MGKRRGLLDDLDPFDIFDAEAVRLDRHFATLDEEAWNRPSRCAGWSVRDVLAHLAGEELYNHACLDGDVRGFTAMLEREGLTGYEDFNEWCVRQRRDLPVEQVLAEWREKNGETRARMRALGRDAELQTSVGMYPVGLQTFHYCSEYATHADDVGAPVAERERDERTLWRAKVGLFALAERGSPVRVEPTPAGVLVHAFGDTASLTAAEFVEATVGRLPAGHPLDGRMRSTLRVLA